MAKDRDDDDEAPLDPAMERVQARLRRLIVVSGATLGIGILAVIGAVVFRISKAERAAGEAWRSTIELPAGAAIVGSQVDGDRLAVTTEGPGGRRIHLYDLPTGRPLGQADLIAR